MNSIVAGLAVLFRCSNPRSGILRNIFRDIERGLCGIKGFINQLEAGKTQLPLALKFSFRDGRKSLMYEKMDMWITIFMCFHDKDVTEVIACLSEALEVLRAFFSDFPIGLVEVFLA